VGLTGISPTNLVAAGLQEAPEDAAAAAAFLLLIVALLLFTAAGQAAHDG
jgi:hypothetical protein